MSDREVLKRSRILLRHSSHECFLILVGNIIGSAHGHTILFKNVHCISFESRMLGSVIFFITSGIINSKANKSIDYILLLIGQSIEDILDGFILRIFIGISVLHIATGVFVQCHSDKSIDYILLLIGQSIEDILNGFTIGIFIRTISMGNIIFVFGFIFIIHLYDIKNIRMVEFFSRINNGFIIQFIDVTIRVLNGDIIDHGTRIRASQNETDFTNDTMLNITTILTQMVGINGQRINVTMRH